MQASKLAERALNKVKPCPKGGLQAVQRAAGGFPALGGGGRGWGILECGNILQFGDGVALGGVVKVSVMAVDRFRLMSDNVHDNGGGHTGGLHEACGSVAEGVEG